MAVISIKKVLKGTLTYPSWSTKSQYLLQFENIDKEKIKAYYIITKGPIKRKIQNIFPKKIKLDPGFCWMLGFIKGEGMNSTRGKSYYRFLITNKNPSLINKVLEELEKSKLFSKKDLSPKSIHILHSNGPKKIVEKYWSQQLNMSRSLINIGKNEKNPLKKSKYEVCHVYISNVLLRLLIDKLNERIIN